MSVIAVVGVMPMYISSRRKKCSMRSKMSLSLSRLVLVSLTACEPQCQNICVSEKMKNPDQEESPDRGKDCVCWWKCLKLHITTETLHEKNKVILTSPTPWPTVAENAYTTFTVGATHLVSPSSLFLDWLDPWTCSRRTVMIASAELHD